MGYKDQDQQRLFQNIWMWRRRMMWIAENGPCQYCYGTQDLRVVYKDPGDKRIRVSAIWSRRDIAREALLAKCMVLCTPCALAKRKDEREPPHGDVGRYQLGCRCEYCKKAKSKDMAEYRASKKEKRGQAATEAGEGPAGSDEGPVLGGPEADSGSDGVPAGGVPS